MQEAKAEIRAKMRALQRALTDEYISESNEKIFKAVSCCPEYQKAGKIFMYCGVGREVDTAAILKHALESGKTVALPKIIGKGEMVAAVIESEDDLETDKFNIPAPVGNRILSADEIDLIIVPGVAFTADGKRLGRGGGYYDRFLASSSAFKIALARRHMIVDDLPMEEYDIKADLVITD